MFKFVKWSFQKRKENSKKIKLRKDHPSFPVITKIINQFQANREFKDVMPYKTAVKQMQNIFSKKLAEMKSHEGHTSKPTGLSPDKMKRGYNSQSPEQAEKKGGSMVKALEQKAYESTERDKQTAQKLQRANTKLPTPNIAKVVSSSGNSAAYNSQAKADESTKEAINIKAQANEEATTHNLIEFVYEYCMNKYGLKNVATKKFTQFIQAVLKFKDQNSRFYIFGRFLQLYEELDENDLKMYYEVQANMHKTILNFTINEDDDCVYIPVPRAIDYFKMTF